MPSGPSRAEWQSRQVVDFRTGAGLAGAAGFATAVFPDLAVPSGSAGDRPACAETSSRIVAAHAANTLRTTTSHRVLFREVAIERHASHVREGHDRSQIGRASCRE